MTKLTFHRVTSILQAAGIPAGVTVIGLNRFIRVSLPAPESLFFRDLNPTVDGILEDLNGNVTAEFVSGLPSKTDDAETVAAFIERIYRPLVSIAERGGHQTLDLTSACRSIGPEPEPEPARPYRCPKCGSTDNLEIVASVWVRLDQSDPDNFETDPVDSNHEWEDNSPMRCAHCDHHAIVAEFEVVEPHPLSGRLFRTNITVYEDNDEYGRVTHPVGSEFVVEHELLRGGEFRVSWQGTALNENDEEVPADGMSTIWSAERIARDAEEVLP